MLSFQKKKNILRIIAAYLKIISFEEGTIIKYVYHF